MFNSIKWGIVMKNLAIKEGSIKILALNDFVLEKRNVYIVLTDINTTISKMVKRITDSKYAHASISLDRSLNHMYSFARKQVYNPFNSGLVIEDIRKGMFKRMPEARIAVFELPVLNLQHEAIESTLDDYWNRRESLKYNVFALKMLVLGGYKMRRYDKLIDYYTKKEQQMKKCGKERYFCSQFVTTVLNKNGINLVDRPAGVVTPQNYYDVLTKMGNLLYEGLAAEYPGGKRSEEARQLVKTPILLDNDYQHSSY